MARASSSLETANFRNIYIEAFNSEKDDLGVIAGQDLCENLHRSWNPAGPFSMHLGLGINVLAACPRSSLGAKLVGNALCGDTLPQVIMHNGGSCVSAYNSSAQAVIYRVEALRRHFRRDAECAVFWEKAGVAMMQWLHALKYEENLAFEALEENNAAEVCRWMVLAGKPSEGKQLAATLKEEFGCKHPVVNLCSSFQEGGRGALLGTNAMLDGFAKEFDVIRDPRRQASRDGEGYIELSRYELGLISLSLFQQCPVVSIDPEEVIDSIGRGIRVGRPSPRQPSSPG